MTTHSFPVRANECQGGDKILRKDMEKYKTEECPRQQYVCPHCEEGSKFKERTTAHLDECPLMKIPCSNLGCTELVARHDMLAHQHDKCKFQVVPCKYAALGCTVKVLRNDLDKHECDREHHIELAVNAVPDLQ